MPYSHHRHHPLHRAAGFSLVEIMVGMVIGLLGIIVIMQVFALFEGQKRTTTGGDDAQNAGAIALYGIQRDIRQSGYGISALNLIGCDVTLRAGVVLSAMAPTTINHASIPAGDANTDTVLVAYGNSNGAPEGNQITTQGATTYAVPAPNDYAPNDLVIAEPQNRPTPCSLLLDRVTDNTSPNVTVATGVAGVVNGTLYNLGDSPRIQAYAIHNGNLTVCDYMANDCSDASKINDTTVWVPVASNIVNMRAQYGRDTSATWDGIVDTYDQTAPATNCDWARASAVRIALVSRNSQYEKTAVTAAAPLWAGSAVTPIDLTQNPDGTANPDWQNYRYKVFQTIVPIRNVIMLRGQTGC